MTIVLPFDAHNHIQMGPTEPYRALLHPHGCSSSSNSREDGAKKVSPSGVAVSGMAIMSTHPRDYMRVLSLSQELTSTSTITSTSSDDEDEDVRIVPCLGVHPWWLHELTDQDWEEIPAPNCFDNDDTLLVVDVTSTTAPRWVHELEALLVAHPEAAIGETGLDGFHFDSATQQLTCPMDRQMVALDWQLHLATKLNRPVSLHCVQAFGPLMDVLSSRQLAQQQQSRNEQQRRRRRQRAPSLLPPAIYFHAFGGKCAVVDQLAALCRRTATRCYFGFAPVINFRSPKTAAVVRHVGLERLLLESDHEDAALVPESVREGIQFYADALGVDEALVVERTTANALDLYGLEL